MLLLNGWMDEWMSEWMNKRKWFLKGHVIIWRQGELIILVTHLIDNCCKWMWPGFNSSFCSLPKIYKYMPLMGVKIRRVIFQGLERIGIVLGMWVSQCCHISGRSCASRVEFPCTMLGVCHFHLQIGHQGPSSLPALLCSLSSKEAQTVGLLGPLMREMLYYFFSKVVSNWQPFLGSNEELFFSVCVLSALRMLEIGYWVSK